MTNALVRDLSDPKNLPGGSRRVDHIETHASDVFLTDNEVFKVKKACDFGFLDFTSLEAREKDSRDEVVLNRRTAPSVYLEVIPVRRDAEGHSLVRDGEIVDWAVRMKRLPDAQSATALLERGQLTKAHLASIAASIASFHKAQPELHADAASMHANIEENFEQIRTFAPAILNPETVASVATAQRAWYRDKQDILEQRSVRDGHGDLRLEHVYLMPEGPTPIDCIEFLDRFRVADPALDIAFFSMELMREGHPVLAEYFAACYAFETGDYAFYPLLNGYLSYRALVRSKVACFVTAGEDCSSEVRTRKIASARQHLQLAHDLLAATTRQPRLIAIGGMIGAGKTHISKTLSKSLGLPIVSADATRKDLAGLEHHQAGPESIYTESFSRQTYTEVWQRTKHVISSGRDVIVDTTFRSRKEREAAAEAAKNSGAEFLFVECRIDAATAKARLRRRQGTLSDAREDLWDSFVAKYEAPIEIDSSQFLSIDGAAPLTDALQALLTRLQL